MKTIIVMTLLVALTGCGNLAQSMPHGKFAVDVGFMGASVGASFDSSNATNTVAGLVGGATTGAAVGSAIK